jgi:hypothetical protein
MLAICTSGRYPCDKQPTCRLRSGTEPQVWTASV